MIKELEEQLKHKNYYNNKFYGDPTPLPNQAEPKIILYKEFSSNKPEYSVVVPVFNQEAVIQKNIISIIRNMDSDFEMIIILDFCVDNTETILLDLFNNISVINLKKIIIIKQETPVFETTCDNMGFLLSTGKYILEIQADMEMVEFGFNSTLAKGFKYNDIIGISGRCTHELGGGAGVGKLGNLLEYPLPPNLNKNYLYMYGTCNRGPLLLDSSKLKTMKYMDEQHFFLHDSDHDLFARAYYLNGWRTGYIPIEFKCPLKDGSTRKTLSENIKKINDEAYRIKYERCVGGFLRTFPYNHQNKIPIEIREL